MKRALAALVAVAAVAVTGCKGGPPDTFTPSPGDPGKPARACLTRADDAREVL